MKGRTIMRRLLWLLLLAGLIPAPLSAQVLLPPTTISAAGSDCSVSTRCAVLTDLRNNASVGVYLNVGTSGTFHFEATIDGTNWFAVPDDVGAASSSIADGAFFFSNAGYRQFRVRASVISGDAGVTMVRGFSGLRSTATLSGEAQGDGAILDGASPSVEATVRDLTNSNPLTTQIVDANGDAITSFGGGTQYTEGETDATITGTALLVEGAANTLVAAPGTTANGLLVDVSRIQGTVTVGSHAVTNAGTFATQSAQSGTWTVQPGNTANTTAWLVTGTGGTFPVTDSGGSLTVDGTVTVTDGAGALNVICDSGCAGGTTDADDASIATGQTTGLNLGLTQVYDGSVWRRLTIGTAGTASAQVLTVQGIASMTPFLVAQSGTWDEVGINDSGNSITVDDGGASLTVDGSISCSNCTGSGASDVDDSSFGVASDSVAPIGILVDETTPDSADEGDSALVRGSPNRNLYIQIRDTSAERSASVTAANELLVEVGAGSADIGNVNLEIGGTAITAGAGAVAATTPRMTLASDDPGVSSLATIAGDTTDIEAAIEGLDHAEDSAHSSGHFGMMALAVRQDSQVDFGADGDYVPLSINDAGELRVAFAGAAGGTSLADDADFTDGTTAGTPIGGVAESASPTTVTEGDFGWAAITLNRALKVSLFDTSGNAVPLNADMTIGSAFGTTGPGVVASYKEFDGSALPTTANVNTEEEAVPFAASLQGVQYTMLVSEDGSLTPLIAHDAADNALTMGIGLRAIAHGTNPTAVAAADRTAWYANRAGVPFVIGGHPNVVSREAQVEDADGAQTNAAIVTVSAGTKIVVTLASMKCDGGNTGPINAVLGFGTSTIPARAHTGTTGIVAAFDGVPAGGGSVEGNGSGILAIGADDEDLRLTMEDPAGGACSVKVSYYTIES